MYVNRRLDWGLLKAVGPGCPPSRRLALQPRAPPHRPADVSLVKRVPETPGSREVRSGLPFPPRQQTGDSFGDTDAKVPHQREERLTEGLDEAKNIFQVRLKHMRRGNQEQGKVRKLESQS